MSERTVFNYGVSIRGSVLDAGICLALCIPMLLTGYVCLPRWIVECIPWAVLAPFWAVRAIGMTTALVSIFMYGGLGRAQRRWYIAVNLWVNIMGLAVCAYSILKWLIAVEAYNESH